MRFIARSRPGATGFSACNWRSVKESDRQFLRGKIVRFLHRERVFLFEITQAFARMLDDNRDGGRGAHAVPSQYRVANPQRRCGQNYYKCQGASPVRIFVRRPGHGEECMGSPSKDRNAQLIGSPGRSWSSSGSRLARHAEHRHHVVGACLHRRRKHLVEGPERRGVSISNLYAETGDRKPHTSNISTAMEGPRNLGRAREALEPESAGPDAARHALVAGGVHPGDVADIIWAFEMFRRRQLFRRSGRRIGRRGRCRTRAARAGRHELHAQLVSGGRVARRARQSLKRQICDINADHRAARRSVFRVVLGDRVPQDGVAAADGGRWSLTLVLVCRKVHVRRLIEQRGRIEAALKQSEARAKATLGSIGEAVIATGPTGAYRIHQPGRRADRGNAGGRRAWDGRWSRVSGCCDERSRVPVDPIEARTRSGQPAEMRACNAVTAHEIRVQAVTSRDQRSAGAPARRRGGRFEQPGFVLILRNMTREHEYIESLAWAATHDGLTGLVNRAEFERRCNTRWARSAGRHRRRRRPASALLFLDLGPLQGRQRHLRPRRRRRDAARSRGALRSLHRARRHPRAARRRRIRRAAARRRHPGIQAVAERLRACLNDFVFHWEAQPFATSVSVGVVDLRDAE